MKLLTILVFFTVNLLWLFPANALGNDTDYLSLLKFKEGVTNDPHGFLKSWNDSVPLCNWAGITCGRRHHRVTSMVLIGQDLVGSISPYIGNLSFLEVIDLENNSFFGTIPQEVGRLFRLQVFYIPNNTIGGEIPVSITNCSQLTQIEMFHNNIVGPIPVEIGLLKKLEGLGLQDNNLTGEIPSSVGNMSACSIFSAGQNNVKGSVPEEMGRLTNLTVLSIWGNNLSGVIPPSIFNITSLNAISLSYNQLHGNLSDNIFLNIPNLNFFNIGANKFSGPIPKSISNCSHLGLISMSQNNFVGHVPNDLGRLQNLYLFNLQINNLGSYSNDDYAFLPSLTNCSKLQILSFGKNHFGGILPSSMVNLSTQLNFLNIEGNQISGSIPAGLGNLVNLIGLNMADNLFTGSIPLSIGKLQNLQKLLLMQNELLGEIPSSIGNITNLSALQLSSNKLEGDVPSSMGNLKRLSDLDLARNNLNGEIPPQLLLLPSLSIRLSLEQNMFAGVLPPEVGKLENLYNFSAAKNNLSGVIPKTIGGCSSLELLYLQENSFEGTIPSSLASMRNLRELDLSRNNLSGQIPKFLEDLKFLEYLNLSFNYFEGEVPVKGVFGNVSALSLHGNTNLCGGIPELNLPKCPFQRVQKRKSSNLKLAIVISCVAISILLMTTFVLLYRKRILKKQSLPLVSSGEHFIKVSYGDVYNATNGFSPSNLIGSGGFGSVYKGSLTQAEKPVAVKVLNLEKKGATKSFKAECRALRNIRHRNLVKILTYCSTIDYKRNEFKALVYEFMANGSLDKWLRPNFSSESNSSSLNFLQRLNISIDIASALHYLHDLCEVPIVHCDLKPSNILLDEDMVAHLSDFGLAKLFSTSNDSSLSEISTIENKGTVGYAAPEYGIGATASKEGDVYSYGILLLEMFSGRAPTDELFIDGLNLHGFVKEALPERLVQIIDPSFHHRDSIVEVAAEPYDDNGIMAEDEDMHKYLLAIFEIGVACSLESPKDRTNMMEVTKKLQLIKTDFVDSSSGGSQDSHTQVQQNTSQQSTQIPHQ